MLGYAGMVVRESRTRVDHFPPETAGIPRSLSEYSVMLSLLFMMITLNTSSSHSLGANRSVDANTAFIWMKNEPINVSVLHHIRASGTRLPPIDLTVEKPDVYIFMRLGDVLHVHISRTANLFM